MHYTHNDDIRPCSLKAEHQSANYLNVNLLVQKRHASTYTPACGYIMYTLQLQRQQSYEFIVIMMAFVLHHSVTGKFSTA